MYQTMMLTTILIFVVPMFLVLIIMEVVLCIRNAKEKTLRLESEMTKKLMDSCKQYLMLLKEAQEFEKMDDESKIQLKLIQATEQIKRLEEILVLADIEIQRESDGLNETYSKFYELLEQYRNGKT